MPKGAICYAYRYFVETYVSYNLSASARAIGAGTTTPMTGDALVSSSKVDSAVTQCGGVSGLVALAQKINE
jgi:hypothetical protein